MSENPKRVRIHDKNFRVMIPSAQVEQAVEQVAEQINQRYAGQTPIIIGVLAGACMFMSDLVRRLNFDCQISYVKLSSYCGTESTGDVEMRLGLDVDIEGRDVVIVEDIVDTGRSMKHLLDYLGRFKPASLAICTLFYKPNKFLYDFPIDFAAMSIGDEFIVGYGLDYDQLGRNLKDVYVVDE